MEDQSNPDHLNSSMTDLMTSLMVIFILLLVNRRDLMGEYVNTLTFNIIAWVTAIAMIALTLVLSYTAIFPAASPPSP